MLSRLVPPACVLLSFPAAVSAQTPEPALVRRPDLQAHYERVERELRAALPPADPQRAAARAAVIDLLHDYRTRGVFGHNVGFPGLREPCFVDDAGRRCAVGWLLDGTGCGDVTQRIAATANHG